MKKYLLLILVFSFLGEGCKSQKRRQEAEAKYKEEQSKQAVP